MKSVAVFARNEIFTQNAQRNAAKLAKKFDKELCGLCVHLPLRSLRELTPARNQILTQKTQSEIESTTL
jgi:hypothetical protein